MIDYKKIEDSLKTDSVDNNKTYQLTKRELRILNDKITIFLRDIKHIKRFMRENNIPWDNLYGKECLILLQEYVDTSASSYLWITKSGELEGRRYRGYREFQRKGNKLVPFKKYSTSQREFLLNLSYVLENKHIVDSLIFCIEERLAHHKKVEIKDFINDKQLSKRRKRVKKRRKKVKKEENHESMMQISRRELRKQRNSYV
ncbi:hypothetical protein IGI37_003782 [Enterococcus sp. AZ194]|uniref:hypothetical protein n=1 Tax=Enterococcus sp. AZ194 TaxID=2774629 RepID=UPI003F27880B